MFFTLIVRKVTLVFRILTGILPQEAYFVSICRLLLFSNDKMSFILPWNKTCSVYCKPY